MMSTGSTPAPLDDLAGRINAEHEACVGAMRSAVEHAIAAGQMLAEVKAALPHGKFLPWVREHCEFSERTAQCYMKAAKWRELNPQRAADLSLREVLSELAGPKPSEVGAELERHELNAVLPAMTDAEFATLKGSIARHGLVMPILLYEGRILDGWHRYRACVELGVEPETRQFAGSYEDAGRALMSLNVVRQHLTPFQKAEMVAKLERAEPGPEPDPDAERESRLAEMEGLIDGAFDQAMVAAEQVREMVRRNGREEAERLLAAEVPDQASALIRAAEALDVGAGRSAVAGILWGMADDLEKPHGGSVSDATYTKWLAEVDTASVAARERGRRLEDAIKAGHITKEQALSGYRDIIAEMGTNRDIAAEILLRVERRIGQLISDSDLN